MSEEISAREVLHRLERRHQIPSNGGSRAWVFASEVRVGTGFYTYVESHGIDNTIRNATQQRIDAFAFNLWASTRFERRAYEIKVTKTDLAHELANPAKAAAALALSNRFFLVVPSQLAEHVKQLDIDGCIPTEWGILTVESSRLRTLKRAPWRDTPNPPHNFMLSVCRNLQRRGDECVPD